VVPSRHRSRVTRLSFRFANVCSTHYLVNVRRTCVAYRRLAHHSRLQREGVTSSCPFGSTGYAFEELITEMGVAFLCAFTRIHKELWHEGYIDSCSACSRITDRAIFRARGQTRITSEYLLNQQQQLKQHEQAGTQLSGLHAHSSSLMLRFHMYCLHRLVAPTELRSILISADGSAPFTKSPPRAGFLLCPKPSALKGEANRNASRSAHSVLRVCSHLRVTVGPASTAAQSLK